MAASMCDPRSTELPPIAALVVSREVSRLSRTDKDCAVSGIFYGWSYGDTAGRALEAIVLLRLMTGIDRFPDAERQLMQGTLQTFTHDGWSYRELAPHVAPELAIPGSMPYACMWDQAEVLFGLADTRATSATRATCAKFPQRLAASRIMRMYLRTGTRISFRAAETSVAVARELEDYSVLLWFQVGDRESNDVPVLVIEKIARGDYLALIFVTKAVLPSLFVF